MARKNLDDLFEQWQTILNNQYKNMDYSTYNALLGSGQTFILTAYHRGKNEGRSTGDWKESRDADMGFWVCSGCGYVSAAAAAFKLYNYCPKCGIKMEVARNGKAD